MVGNYGLLGQSRREFASVLTRSFQHVLSQTCTVCFSITHIGETGLHIRGFASLFQSGKIFQNMKKSSEAGGRIRTEIPLASTITFPSGVTSTGQTGLTSEIDWRTWRFLLKMSTKESKNSEGGCVQKIFLPEPNPHPTKIENLRKKKFLTNTYLD